MERLSDADRAIVRDCLRAAIDGPFFPDWEVHTLFGLTRAELTTVLDTWPAPADANLQDIAVTNTLNHLLSYPHHKWDAWQSFISATPEEVQWILSRWLGHECFDGSVKGYFDRMK